MNVTAWSADGNDWLATTHPEDHDLTDCDVMSGFYLDDKEVLLDLLQSDEVSWTTTVLEALEVDGMINSHAVAERLISSAVAIMVGEGMPRYLSLKLLEQMTRRALNEVEELER